MSECEEKECESKEGKEREGEEGEKVSVRKGENVCKVRGKVCVRKRTKVGV